MPRAYEIANYVKRLASDEERIAFLVKRCCELEDRNWSLSLDLGFWPDRAKKLSDENGRLRGELAKAREEAGR